MNQEQAALWERVREFQLDGPGTVYPFRDRLAKENGWTRDFAGRVVEEYRRFTFLAAAAGHPVSPPDAVDQAWHLHLVYTRSYWEEFCGRVLCKPLHHEPSRGGFPERAKFGDWYARTLRSYRRFFSQDPPADVWPSAQTKGGIVQQFRRVDVSRHWVIRKPRLSVGLPSLCAAAAATITLGCSTGSRSDWSAMPFGILCAAGVFYVVASIISLVFRKPPHSWRRHDTFGSTSSSGTSVCGTSSGESGCDLGSDNGAGISCGTSCGSSCGGGCGGGGD